MSPRILRFLEELLLKDKVYVKDLRQSVGALNPAQIAFSLRKRGWDIHTGFITMQDRDGQVCHPGYYWLDDKEKEKAWEFLKRVKGADATAPLTENPLEHSDSQPLKSNDTRGGEYDKPST